jgi:hypothetical protein
MERLAFGLHYDAFMRGIFGRFEKSIGAREPSPRDDRVLVTLLFPGHCGRASDPSADKPRPKTWVPA